MPICERGFEYSFDSAACANCGGRCCTGETGNVFVNADEIALLAAHFDLKCDEFAKLYLRKVGWRWSLKEVAFEGGFACILFDKDERKCGAYALRPQQCRSFPFWEYFKTHKEELKRECIGVCFSSSPS